MGKKKKRKTPAQKTPAPVLKKRAPFFALPRCPECGRIVPYRQVVARPPVFSVPCRCKNKFRCRSGAASLILWLCTVLICLGMIRLIIAVSTDMIPVFFFTVLFVIAAFFLHPLTVRAVDPKKKKSKNAEDGVHLPEKNEK